jgi:Periplasmic component of the Tol biopolymer transport system
VLYGSWGPGGLEEVRIAVATLGSRRKQVLDLPGIAPLGVAEGQLLFSRTDRNLWAVPFDPRSARLSGPPVVVGSNMLFIGSRGGTKAALSASGSLVYLDANARESQLVLAGPGVAPTPIPGPPRAYAFPRYSPDGRRIAVTVATDPRSDVWLLDLASEPRSGSPPPARSTSGPSGPRTGGGSCSVPMSAEERHLVATRRSQRTRDQAARGPAGDLL